MFGIDISLTLEGPKQFHARHRVDLVLLLLDRRESTSNGGRGRHVAHPVEVLRPVRRATTSKQLGPDPRRYDPPGPLSKLDQQQSPKLVRNPARHLSQPARRTSSTDLDHGRQPKPPSTGFTLAVTYLAWSRQDAGRGRSHPAQYKAADDATKLPGRTRRWHSGLEMARRRDYTSGTAIVRIRQVSDGHRHQDAPVQVQVREAPRV